MSILSDIKTLLNVSSDDSGFDSELIILINGVFSTLRQLGIGSESGFSITGNTETWSDFVTDTSKIENVKTYVYLKVKLIFDPPVNSAVAQSYKEMLSEIEWRMNSVVDYESEDD